jgi:hypothetical protein
MASGTKVADVFVDIGYDLTNYRKGLSQAKTESQSLGAQIKTALSDPAGFSGKSGIAGLIADLKMGRSLIPSLQTAAKGLGGDLKSLSVSALHTGLTGIKTLLGSLGSIASQVGKGLLLGLGVGVGLGLVQIISKLTQAIPDLINKGKDYGQRVADIVHATGATGEAASKVAATINFLAQGPVNNLTQLLAQLARNVGGAGTAITKSEKDFKQFGISIRDSNGQVLNGVDLLERLRSGLSKVADGSDKLALIQQAVGRGGAKVFIDYLRLSDSQMKALVADFQAQGLIITTEQANLAENTNREMNRLGNAWSGLANILFNTVGPEINAFITTITNWITSHAHEIADTVGNIVSSILGFVAGLTGASFSMDSFTASLGGQVTSLTTAQEGQIEAQNTLDTYVASQKAAKTATDAGTAATDAFTKAKAAETAAVDKQITALKALDTQQDLTYKSGLAGLNAQLDAQGKLMDAQDQAVSRMETAANLQRSLRDANEALAKAQLDAQTALATAASDTKLSPQAKAQAQIDAANSIRSAEEALSQARQAIADNARTLTEEDRKAQIQSVKDELTAIDKIVSDAGLAGGSSKTALADLEKRRKELTVGGAPAAGSDSAIELAAVLAAETRVRQQSANTAKQTALDLAKAEISAAKQTAASVTDAKLAGYQQDLVNAKKDVDAEIANEKRLVTNHQAGEVLMNASTQSVFGPEGSATKAFTDWETTGVNAAQGVHDAFVGADGKGGLIGVFGSIVDAIKGVAGAIGGIKMDPQIGTVLGVAIAALGASHGNVPLALLGLGMTGLNIKDAQAQWAATEGTVLNAQDKINNKLRPGTSGGGTWPGKASGGAVWPNNVYRINEGSPVEGLFNPRYPNVVVPAPAMPAFANTASGSIGGQPAIIRLEIGGKQLLDYIDEQLAYRRRR